MVDPSRFLRSFKLFTWWFLGERPRFGSKKMVVKQDGTWSSQPWDFGIFPSFSDFSCGGDTTSVESLSIGIIFSTVEEWRGHLTTFLTAKERFVWKWTPTNWWLALFPLEWYLFWRLDCIFRHTHISYQVGHVPYYIYIYTYIHPIISRYISVLKGLLPPLLMANHPWFSHLCCKDPMKSKTRLGRARKVLELASQNAEWALGQEEEVQVRGKTCYEPKVQWAFGCWEVCGFCMAKTHTHI